MFSRERIIISGKVQGVGCRPFIYKTATQLNLSGLVYNDVNGVSIEVQGAAEHIESFVGSLRSEQQMPPLMAVTSCHRHELPPVANEKQFVIQASDAQGTPSSQVMADSATCPDCLREMNDPADFRHNYPFINCTNCGPRYSIVKTIPYDRCNTTMSAFEMCDKCRAEYIEVTDRRFHAQPVACPKCGPKIWLSDAAGQVTEKDSSKTIVKAAKLLREGKIVAIKGIGGYHLAVDATNEQAVVRLRERKRRDHKPFAMMAATTDKIGKYARVDVDTVATELLESVESPVVVLPQKDGNKIAPSVATGVNTFGFMLCYAPLHHLLFAQEGIDVLVMTSANLSDEPLICDNDEALSKLGRVADAFLMHDREIFRQVDDSVVHVIDGQQAMLRRSRGFAPSPVLQEKPCPKHIFAAGADLKNTFCFVKGNQLILSEHIGDLEDGLVYRHYRKSVAHLKQLFEVEPEIVACDLHPGYFSTQFAHSLNAKQVITVQHHWAHIASVLAEYDYNEPVIGLVADGTGLGTDDAVWGGECLIASLTEFERFGHIGYFPLPGADKASKEPIRPVMGLLSCIAGAETMIDEYGWLLERIEPDKGKVEIIATQIQKQLNTAKSSSVGRLFDAVAAMAGLGNFNDFEAQLPMALEAVADPNELTHYSFEITGDPDETLQIDFRPMLTELLEDIRKGTCVSMISAKFHNFIAVSMLELAKEAREKSDLNTVALSGGVFCNRYLSNRLITMLKANEFTVLFKKYVPANDGGIALGQAAIAAAMVRS